MAAHPTATSNPDTPNPCAPSAPTPLVERAHANRADPHLTVDVAPPPAIAGHQYHHRPQQLDDAERTIRTSPAKQLAADDPSTKPPCLIPLSDNTVHSPSPGAG